MKRLSELKSAETGVIVKISGHGSFRQRITEMGFVRGKEVTVIKNAPFMDPVEYEIMGYRIALRRSEAELIEVYSYAEALDQDTLSSEAELVVNTAADTATDAGTAVILETRNRQYHEARTHIRVALVGNPNCGKTSLFNKATHANERVGNYSGVTVDAVAGHFNYKNYTIHLVDLPGTYSLTAYTPEELYVRRHLLEELPDVILNVIDTPNIERNMFLTTQLIDMNLKVVVALNMYDELEASGARLDYAHLGRMLGIPMIPTVASRAQGMDTLFDTLIAVFEDNEPTLRHIHIHYGDDIEKSISQLQLLIWENEDITARMSSRYLAIKLLESDTEALKLVQEKAQNHEAILGLQAKEVQRLERFFRQNLQTSIADAKYGFISGALQETYSGRPADSNEKMSRIDRVLTNKYWGIPIFLLFLFIMFQATFSLGAYPQAWLESGVAWLGNWLGGLLPEGGFKDLLVDGIISGVGGVLVFLPNILILFFFISIMEDSGYMARAAFMMDRLMHKMGLHGKSFIPLLMGFGCSVPAIMATRTLQSRKDRILTMLIIPFMSCSARLPVYVLLISAFFVRSQGLVLFSIYLTGIVVGFLSSVLFQRFFFAREEAPFVMELPPYRRPTIVSVTRHMWFKGAQYLQKMGTVILAASIIIWALGYFPVKQSSMEESYIGKIGHFIEPTLRPLGFDWQMGVAIASGFAAKEVIVSTMAVLSTGDPEAAEQVEADGSNPVVRNLRQHTYADGPRAGEKVYSPLVAYGFMLFVLLYFPCIAAVVAIYREAGRRWALFIVCYTTALAWVISCLVYQIGSLIG